MDDFEDDMTPPDPDEEMLEPVWDDYDYEDAENDFYDDYEERRYYDDSGEVPEDFYSLPTAMRSWPRPDPALRPIQPVPTGATGTQPPCSHGIAALGDSFGFLRVLRGSISIGEDGGKLYAVCNACKKQWLMTATDALLAGSDFQQVIVDCFLEGRVEDGFAIIYEFMHFNHERCTCPPTQNPRHVAGCYYGRQEREGKR